MTRTAPINSTQLAKVLGVSLPRISQLVSDGRLDGCYTGEGRNRRFDAVKVADALGRKLDPGQMMGNGAGTKAAIRQLQQGAELALPAVSHGTGARGLDDDDKDRYELARIDKAEQEARRLRRQNAAEEGIYVLASEVEGQVARKLAQEIAETESMLRAAARAVADRMGVDAREVRQVLTETWRAHRSHRAEVLTAEAEVAQLSPAELEADI